MQKLSIENKIKNLEKVAEFIEQFCAENNLSPKISFELNLVLDELVTNIIHYAYADKETHLIDLIIEKGLDEVKMKVIDDGHEFNPLERADPKTDISLQDRSVGGLGIFFVKQKVDKVAYLREEDKNILTLIKKI